MSMQDNHLRTSAPLAAKVEPDARDTAIGGQLPVARKRVMFRYWLGAIVLGGLMWAGIAAGLGLI